MGLTHGWQQRMEKKLDRARKERHDYIRQSMKDAQQFAIRWGNKYGDGYKTNAEALAVARSLDRALEMLKRTEVS